MVASLQVHAAGAYVDGGFRAPLWECLAAVGLPGDYLEMVLAPWRELRRADSLASTLVNLGASRAVGELSTEVLAHLSVGAIDRYAGCAGTN
eukprot:1775437-Alexandrium_andersonii.AAC.1